MDSATPHIRDWLLRKIVSGEGAARETADVTDRRWQCGHTLVLMRDLV